MMIIGVFTVLGFIIVLGFLGNFLFERTGIPDILILLGFGLLLGPVLKFVNPFIFEGFSEIFASLALMILLFEGGLNLKIYKVFQESPRAILMSIIGVMITMGITILFARVVLGWDYLPGLLLGAMIGGSSSSIVIPLIRKVKVSGNVETLMALESAFTDALTVVLGIAIIQLLVSPTESSFYSISHVIASAFSIGAMSGLIVGVIWLKILNDLESESYRNILTIAIVFLLFSFTESLGGNGAISSLMFGLILGNGRVISRMIRAKEEMKTEKEMIEFHSEISFLVRTFFFVYLGTIVMIGNWTLVAMSVLLSLVLLIGRFGSVFLSTLGDEELMGKRKLMSIMMPRGLAAAVLSQLPMSHGLPNAIVYPDIVITVIISSVVICTVGIFIVSKKKMKRVG